VKRKSLSSRRRFEVLKRDGFTCQYCGACPPTAVLHVDHIVPVSRGGENSLTNLITACSECNLGKAAVPLTAKRSAASARVFADEWLTVPEVARRLKVSDARVRDILASGRLVGITIEGARSRVRILSRDLDDYVALLKAERSAANEARATERRRLAQIRRQEEERRYQEQYGPKSKRDYWAGVALQEAFLARLRS
jgi:excisionase family DNA binding protein